MRVGGRPALGRRRAGRGGAAGGRPGPAWVAPPPRAALHAHRPREADCGAGEGARGPDLKLGGRREPGPDKKWGLGDAWRWRGGGLAVWEDRGRELELPTRSSCARTPPVPPEVVECWLSKCRVLFLSSLAAARLLRALQDWIVPTHGGQTV